MGSNELRKKFLEFFEKHGHKIVPSSSLIPTDPSVLFTTAGMQQFKPYFLGEKSPYGKNVASCQKCFRTSDIDEVGDERHLTFFEMLGNFSFGGYGKEEAIKLAYELLISNFKLPISKMTVTVFGGNGEIPRDEESVKIWEKIGFSEKKGNLFFRGKEDNFWGPTGEEGPCGPTTEIYSNGVEIWNLVFNEYYQAKDKILTPLKQKGVDTGMGLERLAMVSQGKSNVFETDLFEPILGAGRIVADHIKGAVFLISEAILPSNMERGYVLRRILRRAIRYERNIIPIAQKVAEIYEDVYPELKSKETDILTVIRDEKEKFEKTLERGLKIFEKVISHQLILYGSDAFDLYQTYGFPPELMKEMCKERNAQFDEAGFLEYQKKHQEVSRAGAEKKFGGHGLSEGAEGQAVKLHTATHLLHASLRKVLGDHVKQMGSDITSERARFDFSHSQKMTPDEIKRVEDMVNQKIKEDLPVEKKEMSLNQALESGALSFFKEKYPEKVTVYSINDFSKEICAGPHVNKTGELGRFRIIKEESSGAGVRRIRVVLE